MANKKSFGTTPLAAVRKRTHGDVFNWLHDHRRTIQRVVERNGAVASWDPFIKRMTAAGITAAGGKPLTPALVSRRWCDVVRRVEADKEKKANAPPRRLINWRTPNSEPPSRPPPPDTGIRFPSWMTEEPPGFRESYPESYGPPGSQPLATPCAPSTSSAETQPQSVADRMTANAHQKLRDMDDYVPPPIVRGKIV